MKIYHWNIRRIYSLQTLQKHAAVIFEEQQKRDIFPI